MVYRGYIPYIHGICPTYYQKSKYSSFQADTASKDVEQTGYTGAEDDSEKQYQNYPCFRIQFTCNQSNKSFRFLSK